MPGYQYTPGGTLVELQPDGSVPFPKQSRDDIGSTVVGSTIDVTRSPVVATNGVVVGSVTRAVGVKPRAISPADVIKLARARLRDVEKEIRRCKALEKERDQLRRLLDAADAKPRAVVRELPKRSAG